MKVHAAILERLGADAPYVRSRPIAGEEVDLAEPQAGELLVRIEAAGVCHSDLSVVDGSRPRPVPMVLGHEAAGVVEAVGPGVADVAKGAHVVLAFVPACGSCAACASGRPALCAPAAAANAEGRMLGGGSACGAATRSSTTTSASRASLPTPSSPAAPPSSSTRTCRSRSPRCSAAPR